MDYSSKGFTGLQLECYERNMNCLGCIYSKYNRGCKGSKLIKCAVKKSIIEYIIKYGVPKNLETKGALDA